MTFADRVKLSLQTLLAFLLLVIIVFDAGKLVLMAIPPMTFMEARAVTPQVEAGGDLVLSYTFTRNRLCRTTLDRFIVETTEQNIVWRNSVPGGPGNVGVRTVKNVIRVPSDIRPGDYELVTMVHLECYEGARMLKAPDAPFTVLAAGTK